jgi:hypothetical protein
MIHLNIIKNCMMYLNSVIKKKCFSSICSYRITAMYGIIGLHTQQGTFINLSNYRDYSKVKNIYTILDSVLYPVDLLSGFRKYYGYRLSSICII